MPLFLYRLNYIHQAGQLAGFAGKSYVYAHDAEEARIVAERDIFTRFRASNLTITLLTEEERTRWATLTPRIDAPFNGGWLPEHERGKEAFAL